jgi:hypothetical protein
MNVEAFFDVVMEYQKTLELNNPSRNEDLIEYLLSEQIKRNPTIIITYGGLDALRKSIKLFVQKDKPEVIEILRKRFCHMELT